MLPVQMPGNVDTKRSVTKDSGNYGYSTAQSVSIRREATTFLQVTSTATHSYDFGNSLANKMVGIQSRLKGQERAF